MTNAIFLPEQLEFVDRGDGSGRTLIGVHDALTQTAAKFWRYPPGTRGKRHAEHVQEELIVVPEGDAAIDIGDPPERFALPRGSVCVIQPAWRGSFATTATRTCSSSSSERRPRSAAPNTSRT